MPQLTQRLAPRAAARITRRAITRLAALLAALLVATVASHVPVSTARDLPAATLDGRTVTTAKSTLTLAPTGLPEQIVTRPDSADLPLAWRSAKPTDEQLNTIGRGPLLRAPMRLEAVIGGQAVAAEGTAPSTLAAAATGGTTSSAALKAGAVPVNLEVTYDAGRIHIKATYGGADVEVDSLSLVLDLVAPVDTIVAQGASAGTLPVAVKLTATDGLLYADTGDARPKSLDTVLPLAKGRIADTYIGNADRGLRVLIPDVSGFDLDAQAPLITVVRDANGDTTLRLLLVNHAAKLTAAKTATLDLMLLPLTDRPADARHQEWLSWSWGAAAIDDAGAIPGTGALRADVAARHLEHADAAVLTGVAGGSAPADGTIADATPMPLFAYLAGTHAGIPARLQTGTTAQAVQGGDTGKDRVAIGRALLNDIGIDPAGLADLSLAARVVTALQQFGYFEADKQTDYLPYWRSQGVLRYGESFAAQGDFAVTTEDPNQHIYVSAWRRPNDAGKAGFKTLILVLNDGPTSVRDQLYVFQPQELFGGPNRMDNKAIINSWDMHGVVESSDWSRSRLLATATEREMLPNRQPRYLPTALRDLEDGGWVRLASNGGGTETYGPLFIPPHSFRLLYGTGGL